MNSESFVDYIVRRKTDIDRELAALVTPGAVRPAVVYESMRHTLLSGGKRLRPITCLAVYEMYRKDSERVLPVALAMELIHTSSLILDDLPCMDDGRMRHGQQTNHLVFGEDIAILASKALLNMAFELPARLLDEKRLPQRLAARVFLELTNAIGPDGIIGGQVIDLESEGKAIDFETLEYIHSHKTGALFIGAARLGAIAAGARERDLAAITTYAKNLGLAFQITDDVLDIAGDPSVTGKDHGADLNKTTFVSFCGVDEARRLVDDLLKVSMEALQPFGDKAERLVQLAEFVKERKQ